MTTLLLLACSLFGAGEVPATTATEAQFAVARGRILLPVTINSKGPYHFMVDAASPFPVIDAATATELGLTELPDSKTEMPDASGNFVTAYAANAALQIRNRELDAGPCVVAPLDALTEWLGVPVHGMISLIHLGNLVGVDFKAETLFWPAATPQVGQAAALTNLDGRWHVKALINGAVAADCVADLGYGGVCAIPESWARENGLLQLGVKRVIIEWGDGAPPLAPAGQLQLRNLRLGSSQRTDVWADIVPSGAYPRLGTQAFAEARTIWDFAGGALYIDGKDPVSRDSGVLAGYGIALGRHDGEAWRIGVAMPSPASRAGLRGGESMISVNGEEMRAAAYPMALEALRADDLEPKAMVFEQDGERIAVNLSPEALR
jgi:hypothetical protein